QWECKADLESGYRFGEIEVSCEGYDYPGDPYILEGSCGLLFSLELTEEGKRRAKGSGGFGYGLYPPRKDSLNSVPGAVVVLVLLALAYGVYRLFLSNQQPPQSFGDGFSGPSWQNRQVPPPPGFKATFTEPDSFGTPFGHGTNSGPGFWTGLGAGGLLGYLAGSHR
ncbi:SARAF factor, partial [Eudromia elegans]|nr:SARAF factor [Eudromia elegans]